MISQDTKDIIQEHFNDLPPVVQDVVLHSNWQSKIRSIVQKNKLHIDQGAAIENLVLVTMLGIETPETFVTNAKEYARVSEDQALSISQDVEREIFHDIRQKLISITESHDTIDEVERVTNELTKADDDIEQAARTIKPAPTHEEIRIPSKASRTPDTLVIPQKREQPKKGMRIIDVTTAVKVPPNVKPKVVDHVTPAPTKPTQKIVLPTTQPKDSPTPAQTVTSTPKKEAPVVAPFIPKQLDPIAAARLGSPTVSAKNRLEMEMSTSSVQKEIADAPATKVYNSVDPYREPVE